MSRAMEITKSVVLSTLAAVVLVAAVGKAADATPARPAAPPKPQSAQMVAPVPAGDTDKTLAALHDELERSRTRLALPGQEKPYYIQYRLLDLDQRTVVAQFGALVASTTSRNRFMSVDVRVGDYKLDNSNFIAGQGFRGFLGGSTGSVGIDRDYDSLRQDLWLATDQGYKQALESISQKRAFLRSLANAPTIDDFSKEPPAVIVEPHAEPDWTSRNWEAEAKAVSAMLKKYPEIYNSRVTYRIVYATTYLVTTEGTQIRTGRSFASIEASLGAETNDGTPVHNFVTAYATRPADLPASDAIAQQIDRAGSELVALRVAPPIQDYDGPVLFEAKAAGSLLAQLVGPSVGGQRPPLSSNSRFEQMMESLGGRSDWMNRSGQRVLPAGVSLLDDPTAQDFQGQKLIGAYTVDQDGVHAQKVALAENGMLRQLLMSRRPGPEFTESNGHGRSTFLADSRPMMSNLFFTSSEGQSPADLRKKFLDACKQNGQKWGLLIREMDNPVVASSSQDELSDWLGVLAGGAANGDRLPLLAYRVNLDDGKEELVRGALLSGITIRTLRNLMAIGNDPAVFAFEQSQDAEIAGTALGAFGSAEDGVPTDVIAPSLLFEEVEVHGPHGEPRRLPLVPPPALQ
jgi:predicted Zn-dependent protease